MRDSLYRSFFDATNANHCAKINHCNTDTNGYYARRAVFSALFFTMH